METGSQPASAQPPLKQETDSAEGQQPQQNQRPTAPEGSSAFDLLRNDPIVLRGLHTLISHLLKEHEQVAQTAAAAADTASQTHDDASIEESTPEGEKDEEIQIAKPAVPSQPVKPCSSRVKPLEIPVCDNTKPRKWFLQIRTLSQIRKWMDEDLLNVLVSRTTGEIHDEVMDILAKNSEVSGANLLSVLITRFTLPDHDKRAERALRDRKQRPTETVSEFAMTFRSLAADVQKPMSEETLIDIFAGNLQRGFADDIILNPPKTVIEAIKMAEKRESLVLLNAAAPASVNTISAPADGTQVNAINGAPRRNITCNYCHIRGHVQAECRKRQRDTGTTPAPSSSSSFGPRNNNRRYGRPFNKNNDNNAPHNETQAPSTPALPTNVQQGNSQAQTA